MNLDIDNLLYIEQISLEQCIQIVKNRFYSKKIYTQLGSVLISINPYQYFHGDDNIYDFSNKDRVHLYRILDKLLQNLSNNKNEKLNTLNTYLDYILDNNVHFINKIPNANIENIVFETNGIIETLYTYILKYKSNCYDIITIIGDKLRIIINKPNGENKTPLDVELDKSNVDRNLQAVLTYYDADLYRNIYGSK